MNRHDYLASYFEEHEGVSVSRECSKFSKMRLSPLRFFRGSAALMYKDLLEQQITLPDTATTLPLTYIMGDCHTGNFGFHSEEGSHGDTLIFEPNDFDDACVGHAVWDLFRFLVSLPLTQLEGGRIQEQAKDIKDRSKPVVNKEQILQAQQVFLQSYIKTCQLSLEHKVDSNTGLIAFNNNHILYKRWQKGLQRMAGGAAFTIKSTLAKEIDLSIKPLSFRDDKLRFKQIDPDLKENLIDHFAAYVDDEILDCVERIDQGTGSLHLSRYYLLVGPSVQKPTKDILPLCHIVEIKQQQVASPLAYFSSLSPVNRLDPAHLTVNSQRKMQRRTDLILDNALWQGSHWLVRSRHHARVGIDPEDITIGKRAATKSGFSQYAETCGEALALSHMRSDRRSLHFQEQVVAVLPDLIDELIKTACHYSEQVIADWRWFCERG
ncbi:DUF2252 domain-containing protein [Pseudoalteromonas sp. J010]|uniref:DUF2252 family protein n=1 Tax=Pseudoalteromonas sp. J010 TaxID=998465 RepID=UPI000F650C09|nr:DUF2252 family protein [Pseudoalteromonas sp. J010]RRS07866.1 DUF2252 domain-containing protein [Pseudoalteromonas sp. J010]